MIIVHVFSSYVQGTGDIFHQVLLLAFFLFDLRLSKGDREIAVDRIDFGGLRLCQLELAGCFGDRHRSCGKPN